MKQTFALVATKQKYTDNNLNDFSISYNLGKLKFKKVVKFSDSQKFNFKKNYIDFYFGETGTLAFFSSPAILEDLELEKSSSGNPTGAFWIDNKSDCTRINIYDKQELIINYVNINGTIKQDIQNIPNLFNENKFNFLIDAVKWVTEINIESFNDNLKLRRYEVTNDFFESKQDVEHSAINAKGNVSKLFEKKYNEDDNYVEELFLKFISEDDSLILEALDLIPKSGTNNIINSYLVNLTYFHRNKKVRSKAKLLIQSYLPETVVNQLDEKITSEHLKEQNYYWTRLVYFDELVVGEYIVLASVTRRNYFNVYQAKGYNLYMDGRGNDIKNALDNSLPLGRLSDRISHLKYLDYFRLRLQKNLDLVDLFNKLSLLPKLKTLEISESNIYSITNDLSKLKSIERLLLDKNPLKEILLFDELPNLKELDISNTELKHLDLKSFPKLTILWVDSKEQYNRIKIVNNYNDLTITSGKYYKETIPKNISN